MLTMDQKQQILHHYRVDEDGLREISRKVGVDRNFLVTHFFHTFKNIF